jgi:hypothetical protein
MYAQNLREIRFCAYGNDWELLFQLMKDGTKTLDVAFIFSFSVVSVQYCVGLHLMCSIQLGSLEREQLNEEIIA